MVRVDKVEAILTIPSIEETAAWYERVLGWTARYDVFDAQECCAFGSVLCGDIERVSRGERPFTGFNLSRFGGDPGSYRNDDSHFTALIAVDDVDAVYARVAESGGAPDIRHPCVLANAEGLFFQSAQPLAHLRWRSIILVAPGRLRTFCWAMEKRGEFRLRG